MNQIYVSLKKINFTNARSKAKFAHPTSGMSEQMSAQTLIANVARQQTPVAPVAQGATGAEILIDALTYEGVDTIFGYPGGAVLHIYDELWRARDRISHYLVRHEQGAVHMAEGYARASGRVGVVLVTSGPGATNAVT